MRKHPHLQTLLAFAAVLATVVLGTDTSLAAITPIVSENAMPGSWQWQATVAPQYIDGYASQVSVQAGDALQFHISATPAARYRINIWRLGWYAGSGGRLVTCIPSCTSDRLGIPQPVPAPDPTTGLLDAGWPITDSVVIGDDWLSGYYLGKIVLTGGPGIGTTMTVPFIVRAPSTTPPSAILVVAPVNTWEAYNPWGGKSLYPSNSTAGVPAFEVSFDRPYALGAQWLFNFELPLVRFLEQEGYDVSYTTDVDVDANPSELLRHRLVIVAGHDEYWTAQMRDAYDNALRLGTNLAFMGANDGYWQMRYMVHRVIVEYKSSLLDPDQNSAAKTDLFRNLDPPKPECELIGVQHDEGEFGGFSEPYTVTAAATTDPWFVNTGLVPGETLPNLVGYEWDTADPTCPHPGVKVLFHYDGGPANADAIRYSAPSGARVFSTGSLQFSWGLDGWFSHTAAIPGLQQFMRNALSDLLRPATPKIATVKRRRGRAVRASRSIDPRVQRQIIFRGDGTSVARVCSTALTTCTTPFVAGDRYFAVTVDPWGTSAAAVLP